MQKYSLRKEITGWVTNIENTVDKAVSFLASGSQNVLIDPRFSKVGSRGGYSLLGALNTALTPIRQRFTWTNTDGREISLRWYDDELEAYLGTVDGVAVSAWTRITNSLSTTATPRACTWWDNTEKIMLMLFVQGDDQIRSWSGAITTLASATSNTLTKNGTKTWAQSGFLTAGTRKVLINGTLYTYTGGETTTTLTGVTGDPSSEALSSVVSQSVDTQDNEPADTRTNDFIMEFENQIYLGSDDDNLVYISKNSDYKDFSESTPRLAGEGATLTLDNPCVGLGVLSKIPVIFAGKSSLYTVEFTDIEIGTTLSEQIKIKKLKTGSNQGAYNQESIVPLGDSLVYLSNEPALRTLDSISGVETPQLRTLSNPIKPDFDAETWTNANAIWHRNRYILSAPSSSKLYILEYVETADGTLKRFWQAPQILPVRCLAVIDQTLYGHSNGVPETYLLFNGTSDRVYSGMAVADKLPISAIAKFSYRVYGDRANLKSHDEFYVEGNIAGSTNDLKLTLGYDFGGSTQETEFTIDGTDEDILYSSLLETSLGQQPLGSQPLGGSVQDAPDLSRFRIVFEMPKEDYHELQETYSSNGADKSWEIISAGGNTEMSKNRNTIIRK